jgi:hypothetical protein
VLPDYLTRVQGLRALQIGDALNWIALPQFVLVPLGPDEFMTDLGWAPGPASSHNTAGTAQPSAAVIGARVLPQPFPGHPDEVGFGSRAVKLRTSICFPSCPRLRTFHGIPAIPSQPETHFGVEGLRRTDSALGR